MTSSNSVFDCIPQIGSEAAWCIGELAFAVREKRYSRAYALLHKIKRENLVLAEEEKASVLADGLRCSLKLFQMLYEQLVGDGREPGRWGAIRHATICALERRMVPCCCSQRHLIDRNTFDT